MSAWSGLLWPKHTNTTAGRTGREDDHGAAVFHRIFQISEFQLKKYFHRQLERYRKSVNKKYFYFIFVCLRFPPLILSTEHPQISSEDNNDNIQRSSSQGDICEQQSKFTDRQTDRQKQFRARSTQPVGSTIMADRVKCCSL